MDRRLAGWVFASSLACGSEPGPESADDATSTEASTTTTDDTTSAGTESTEGDSSTDSGSTSGSEADTGEDSGTTGGGSEGCGQPSPGPGTHTDLWVDVGGEAREYRLFVPSGYSTLSPAPLVLNFHGLLGSPSQQASLSEFDDAAEARGMLVAYPVGIGQSFNSGGCCGEAETADVNDVLFSRRLVEEVSAQLCVDPNRVYATGMSNGGHMAHRLGCQAADVFAAVASVSGVLGLAPADCNPARPISVMDFHGTSDFVVPYGGAGPGFPEVGDMMRDWAARNGCSPTSRVSFDEGDMRCETWPGCGDGVEVTLCTIDGGGHCWPGTGTCVLGNNSDALHASEAIADMFLSQPLLP